jgi:hypothetical protein
LGWENLGTEDREALSLHLVISKGPNEWGWDWGGGVEGLPRIGGDVTLVV